MAWLKKEEKIKERIGPNLDERSKSWGYYVARPSESVQKIDKCSQSGQGDAYNKFG